MWEEILAKMSLQVGEVLDAVNGVEDIETHTSPVAHEETKRGASFRG